MNSSTELIQKVMIEDAPKAKSKNLNVVAEYGKSTRKNTANFVVIGKKPNVDSSGPLVRKNVFNELRACRRWEKHFNGPSSLRPEGRRPTNY